MIRNGLISRSEIPVFEDNNIYEVHSDHICASQLELVLLLAHV